MPDWLSALFNFVEGVSAFPDKSARQVKPPRVSSRTVVGDKLFTNKDVQFESLGDMKAR